MCNRIFQEVLQLVAEETELSKEAILSKSRQAEVIDARHLVVWFCFTRGVYRRSIAEFLGITRQAVCQKIQAVPNRMLDKPFRYHFERLQENSK